MRSLHNEIARNHAVSLKGLVEAHPHLRNDAVLVRLALGGNPYAEVLLAAAEVDRLARRNANTPRSREMLANSLQMAVTGMVRWLEQAAQATRDLPPHPAMRAHVRAVTEAAQRRAQARAEEVWPGFLVTVLDRLWEMMEAEMR